MSNRFWAVACLGSAALPSFNPIGHAASAVLVAGGVFYLINAIREPQS